MQNRLCLLFILSLGLGGCSDKETADIGTVPLVLNVRFDITGSSPQEVEKYFVKPLITALNSAHHVSTTHGIAMSNSATITVFFEDGVHFAEGEAIVESVLKSTKTPKKYSASSCIIELNGDDLSQSNLMHIAQAKGVKPENVMDNFITVTESLAENLLPKEEFDSMFSNDCDEAPDAPLYILNE
jgi:hypothetical protein